jgi:hypothetical protein
VIVRPEKEELFFVVVPVAPDTAEYASPIIERVGQNTNLGFAVGNDTPFEKGEIRQSHDEILLQSAGILNHFRA